MNDESGQEPVGSVAEEATKLLRALEDWARDSGSEYAGAAAGAATQAAAALDQLNEHIAHGEDCRYCPLCRLISTVRATSPEVKGHLRSAVSSLIQAAAGAMVTHIPDPPGRPGGGSRVEKIDLSDDADREDN